MKKLLIIIVLCDIVMLGNAQAEYDTVYFRSNKIEVNDTSFINNLVSILNEDTICTSYTKYSFYSMQVFKTDSNIEVVITMLPRVLKWASTAAGYFFIGKSLFFIKGDLTEEFAHITKSTKRFYYKVPNPNVIQSDFEARIQEFCVIVMRLENGRWRFVEERMNY